MSRLSPVSVLLILGVGCAGMQHPAEVGVPLGQQGGEPLLVTESAITGPSSSLRIADGGMRGRFLNQPLSLSWTYQSITGAMGERATNLEVAEGDDTRIWGTFAGAPVDVTLEREWVYGRVGECSYALKRVQSGYVGKRDCGGALEGEFDLAFSEHLLQRPLGEKATLMTLMLVNHVATFTPNISLASFARPLEGLRKRKTCTSTTNER
jgi:hypothetical protein